MSWVELTKALVGLNGNLTLYAAPCVSTGAIAAVFHQVLNLDLGTAFTLGFFVGFGPIYLVYASGRNMRGALAEYHDWRAAGLIQAKEYDRLRRAALAWFQERRYGD